VLCIVGNLIEFCIFTSLNIRDYCKRNFQLISWKNPGFDTALIYVLFDRELDEAKKHALIVEKKFCDIQTGILNIFYFRKFVDLQNALEAQKCTKTDEI